MNHTRPANGTAAAPERRPGHATPIDLKTIRTSIRQATTERRNVPNALRIDHLRGLLRGHIGLLLCEPLGRDDAELKSMRAEAEFLLRCGPTDDSRAAGWSYVQALGYTTKGLLRRYIEAHPEV